MSDLVIAVPRSLGAKLEKEFDERTAGKWRDSVKVVYLFEGKENTESNNGDIEDIARSSRSQIFATKELTSKSLSDQYPQVKRHDRRNLIESVNDWFDQAGIAWRTNVRTCRDHGAYRWTDLQEWRLQFDRVDPVRGLRLAAALLAQLRIVRLGEMADWFDDLSTVEHNLFFIGSDPHSGDFGIINALATRIPGPQLTDAQEMPPLKPAAKVRLFSDGGWSGGESVRRLECLYVKCASKSGHIGPGHSVQMRFAYLTDTAERRLGKKIEALKASGSKAKVHVSYPQGNRLLVDGEHGVTRGLAFQDQTLRNYVDSADHEAMRRICESIGKQLSDRRPLGTEEIASTIAFEHSLPKAMLPLLIVDSGVVRAHDGSTFEWKPLLKSKHVSDPARDKTDRYCFDCPLRS